MAAHSYRVFVKGIEVYAFHGCSTEEQTIGHRYVMDIDLRVAGRGHEVDELDATLDYGPLTELAVKVATESSCLLMEYVAHRTAQAILFSDERVRVCTITLAKRLPPIPFVASEAGVSVTVNR
mgnify:CR=1 FL=1